MNMFNRPQEYWVSFTGRKSIKEGKKDVVDRGYGNAIVCYNKKDGFNILLAQEELAEELGLDDVVILMFKKVGKDVYGK